MTADSDNEHYKLCYFDIKYCQSPKQVVALLYKKVTTITHLQIAFIASFIICETANIAVDTGLTLAM